MKCVIFDVDGTLLDSERILLDVYADVIRELGGTLTPESYTKAIGTKAVSLCSEIVRNLGLPVTGEELYSRTQARLVKCWPHVRLMPGVERLVGHLRHHGVRMALATSSTAASLAGKLQAHQWVRDAMEVVVCGDEVAAGKPHPETYEAVLQRLGVPATSAVALEDSPAGVESALSAGLEVVAIPSVRSTWEPMRALQQCHAPHLTLLPSIMDLQPQAYGLPPFTDTLAGAVPIEPPIRVAGTVVKGFGRGSRDLGLRTANVDTESVTASVSDAVSGVYLGWGAAVPATGGRVVPMVMSIGWNPFYHNATKSAEAWLLVDLEGKDFYGDKIYLCVCGYIRPETDFDSLEALKARIHLDAEVAQQALQDPRLQAYKEDAVFKDVLPAS